MILIETFFDSAEKLVRIYHPETRRKTEYVESSLYFGGFGRLC